MVYLSTAALLVGLLAVVVGLVIVARVYRAYSDPDHARHD